MGHRAASKAPCEELRRHWLARYERCETSIRKPPSHPPICPPFRCTDATTSSGDRAAPKVPGDDLACRREAWNVCSLLGRRGIDLGLAIWFAPIRLFLPAEQGTLRPGAAVPLRWQCPIAHIVELQVMKAAGRTPCPGLRSGKPKDNQATTNAQIIRFFGTGAGLSMCFPMQSRACS
jgi:hypothetical protein